MLTVNLEKELIRQNKRVVTSEELLYIKEYDQLAPHLPKDDTLTRVFGETAAEVGMAIKETTEQEKKETEVFNKERVFHISQIETLCKKYHLKFLPSIYYSGTIDKHLPGKISQFEIAYNARCNPWTYKPVDEYSPRRGSYATGGDTFVAAPANSFALEERPKDPLMFYKINESYYYLIHKWGNDINIVRRLYSFFSRVWVCFLTLALPLVSFAVYAFIKASRFPTESAENIAWSIPAVICCALVGIAVIIWSLTGNCIRFVKPNNWKSAFKD